ncbi:MAG: MerR family transcriptional regulator [Thermodesulfobacteriota bacterium]
MMVTIPEKLYFKIGEVSTITRVKPYVLRYWESEFKIISPRKSNGKQRVYTRKDVDLILRIKELLYKDRLTLEGAKKRMKELKKEGDGGKGGKASQLGLPFSNKKYMDELKGIKKELGSIRKLLGK